MSVTNIEMEAKDCAILFKESGECQLIVPSEGREGDEISDIELLVSGLTLFLRDPKFVEAIKSDFIKHLECALSIKDKKKIDKLKEKE